ncbi:MAG: hypothetical protein JW827_01300 [Spirochaetes bacterium]|nr:hypothetical protein [Spirochaetota bacterium]
MPEDQTRNTDAYYVIKGRFHGTNSNTYGLFIMFISVPLKSLDNILVAASHFSSIFECRTDLPWGEFEETISQLKWKGEVSQNISHDLQLLLANTIKRDSVEEFIYAIEGNEQNKLNHTFENIISKGLLDKVVTVEFQIEKITHQDILNVKDERARKEKEEKEAQKRAEIHAAEAERFKVEEGAVMLDSSLVLAPVSGIPIDEAKTGDQIMMKLSSTTERGNYFIDLLNARSTEGVVKPVKGLIKEVFLNALGEYQIIAEIGPGIYARAIEAERVKIKQYEATQEAPAAAVTSKGAVSTSAESSLSIKPPKVAKTKDYFIWVVGAITFILAILIFYLFLSGIL